MRKGIVSLISVWVVFFTVCSAVYAGNGYMVTSDLQIRAVIGTEEKGSVEAVWQQGGTEMTARGDKVIWGHFYASPSDVTWGSSANPDLFVKIWFDAGGRIDVNFFHVSVPEINVYSTYSYDGIREEQGKITMDNRYVRHEYYGPTPVPGIDSDEEGSIRCGDSLSGIIDEPDETDDFTFDALAGEVVVIAVENQSTSALFQPCWRLLDPSENPVIAIGDHSGHTSCETYKSYNIPDDGLFTIRIYDDGNDAKGKYNIRLEPLTAYLNGELSCAEPIACGNTEYGTLESRYSADSYRLTAKAGEVIAIVSENKSMSALFQPCWKLLDPSSEPVIAVGDHSGHTSCETNKYYKLPSDGPFTVRVYDENRDGKGDYSIRLEPISAYFNGELSCAKMIEYDKTESGTLESNHAIDTYMFYEKDGEVIEITVTDQGTSSLFEPCWQLLNRSIEPVIAIGDHSGHTSCETTKSYNIPIEGYFIIRIYDNYQDGKGDYEITVKKL